VLHEYHLIIRVGAGLIQFVYGSHSRMAADLTLDKNLFSLPFSRVSPAIFAGFSCHLGGFRSPYRKQGRCQYAKMVPDVKLVDCGMVCRR